jgi:hypothetical protein
LRRTAYAAQRILDFMGKLANHLPARAVLNQQRIFPADFRAARDIRHLDEQLGRREVDRRHATVDDALIGVNFGRSEPQFVGIVIAGCEDAAKNIAELGLIIEQAQHRFTASPLDTDTQQVFGGRVEVDDQQAAVNENNSGTETIENALRIAAGRPVIAGTAAGCAA